MQYSVCRFFPCAFQNEHTTSKLFDLLGKTAIIKIHVLRDFSDKWVGIWGSKLPFYILPALLAWDALENLCTYWAFFWP